MDSRTKQAKEKYEGKLFPTTKCGFVEVLCWNSSTDIDVVFINTGYKTKVRKGNLQQGTIKDRSIPTLYGVGIIGELTEKFSSKRVYAYNIWTKMLERCYCEKTKYKNPTYNECTVSDNFKNFQYFYSWCKKQKGFNVKDWHLDKDIIIKGNKVYSEDTCCFVPKDINNLLLKNDISRGDFLLGVHKIGKSGKFRADISKYGKGIYLGEFETEAEAFLTYKRYKEDYIKDVAEKWKDQIDPRVYNALIMYEVNCED